MPSGTSGSVLVVIVGPPVPCRDYDRRYHLRPGTVIQAYRKLTLSSRAIDYGGIHNADRPSTRCVRHLSPKHLSQHLLQPNLGFPQTIKKAGARDLRPIERAR